MIFSLSEKQIELYIDWNSKHKRKCPYYNNDGTIGGRLTFTFTPTGLGPIIKVKCMCGKEIDITESDNW